MGDVVNACPDCGSTQRTMIQDASTGDVVWSCEHGHTWRDSRPAGPVKKEPARRAGAEKSSAEKEKPQR